MKITTSWPQDPCNVHICWFGWEKCKNVKSPKMTFSLQVRSHENLQIFRLSGKPFKMMKITTSWQQDPWNVHICWFGWEICKNVKCPNMTFFSQVHGHENLQIFLFSGKPLKMMKTTTSWPQDPWNLHICWFGWEICKNAKCPKMTFFSQVHGHENLQIFRLSGKPLKNDENHHQLTTGPLKCAYLLIWVRNMQKWEMPKNDIFLAGPRSWKSSIFFDFLESLLKWWKSPPVDHRTLEMCIFADLGEKYAKMWNAQKCQFVASPRSWKSSNFSTFWKALKMMKTTTSWQQDPWNVHICWFGWEIRKNVKCQKITFFSQVRGHENH